jgi:hypothetical protein
MEWSRCGCGFRVHNARNATAALGVVVASTDPAPALQAWRFAASDAAERLGGGASIAIVDDYAHHPTELRATLAARQAYRPPSGGGVSTAPLFPHGGAGRAMGTSWRRPIAIVTDVYAAREAPVARSVERWWRRQCGVRRCDSLRTIPRRSAPVAELVRPGDVLSPRRGRHHVGAQCSCCSGRRREGLLLGAAALVLVAAGVAGLRVLVGRLAFFRCAGSSWWAPTDRSDPVFGYLRAPASSTTRPLARRASAIQVCSRPEWFAGCRVRSGSCSRDGTGGCGPGGRLVLDAARPAHPTAPADLPLASRIRRPGCSRGFEKRPGSSRRCSADCGSARMWLDRHGRILFRVGAERGDRDLSWQRCWPAGRSWRSSMRLPRGRQERA